MKTRPNPIKYGTRWLWAYYTPARLRRLGLGGRRVPLADCAQEWCWLIVHAVAWLWFVACFVAGFDLLRRWVIHWLSA